MSDTPTPAELRALRAYRETGKVRDAADRLGLAESTVKGELGSLRAKFGVHKTWQLFYILHDKLAA